MDFFKTSFQQLSDLFKSMTPGARVTAGLLLLAVVISVAWLFRFGTTAEADEFLFGGESFSTKELDAMEAAFSKVNLTHWTRDGGRMRVPHSTRAQYIAALADAAALPSHFDTYLDEAVATASPFESKDERQSRLRIAKQKRLSQIVSQMAGVEQASVTYDEQEKGGFPRRTEKTASVAVWADGGAPLSDERVRTIRDTVASAIAGLPPENVTIIDQNAGVSHAGSLAGGAPAANDPYAVRKRRYEQEWRDKIQRALTMIPGLVVEVNVELDPELIHEQEVVKVDPTAVAISSRDVSRTSTMTNTRPGGRPGAVPNAVANSGAAVGAGDRSQSQDEQTESSQESVASHTRTKSEKASFIPNRVAASVSVPESYYLAVWRRKNPTPDGQPPVDPPAVDLQTIREETRRTIEEAVVTLFPKLKPGEDIYPQVRVNSFPDLPVPAIAAPGVSETASAWLGANWKMLAMLAFAGVALLMARGVLRQPPTAPGAPAAASSPGGSSDTPRDADEEAEPPRVRRFQTTPTLRDELAELVRDDPDAAANVLRSWIGEAG